MCRKGAKSSPFSMICMYVLEDLYVAISRNEFNCQVIIGDVLHDHIERCDIPQGTHNPRVEVRNRPGTGIEQDHHVLVF